MSTSSGNRKNAVLRTYSRRANLKPEGPLNKKRRVSEIDDTDHLSLGTESVHMVKKSKASSPQSPTRSRSERKHSGYVISRSSLSPLRDITPANSLSSPKKLASNKASSTTRRPRDATLWPQESINRTASDDDSYLQEELDRTEEVNAFSPGESISEKLGLGETSPTKFQHVSQKTYIHQQTSKVNGDLRDGAPSSSIKSPKSSEQLDDLTTSITSKKRSAQEYCTISAEAAGSAPPLKKSRPSGIHHYFKPLPRSSSPSLPRSDLQSSDSIDLPEAKRTSITPPSSPPPTSLFDHPTETRKRRPRRLTTKPNLEPLDEMSYHSSRSTYFDDDSPSFDEIIGDGNDASRAELAEHYLDDEEKDDLSKSAMVSERNRPRSDSYHVRSQATGRGHNALTSSSLAVQHPRRFVGNPESSDASIARHFGGDNGGEGSSRPIPVQSASSPMMPLYPSSMRDGQLTSGNPSSNPYGNPYSNTYGNSGLMVYGSDRSIQRYERPDYDFDEPPRSLAIPVPMSRRTTEPVGYTQLQLDLGLAPKSITCVKCNMTYVPSNHSDKRHHDEFCKTSGMPELSKSIENGNKPIWQKFTRGDVHQIRVYDRTSTAAQRNHAQKILEETYHDLPGLKYTDSQLSETVDDPIERAQQFHSTGLVNRGQLSKRDDPRQVPRFKIYVYYLNKKVVGVMLVERFHEFDTKELVELGEGDVLKGKHIIFERLWVNCEYRRMGYAAQMADVAREDFIPGLDLPKTAVAMPEQTALGKGFSKGYFA